MIKYRNIRFYGISFMGSILFILMCVGVSCSDVSTPKAQNISLAKIAFESDRDGSNMSGLTGDGANHGDPAWFPNVPRIIFSSNIDGPQGGDYDSGNYDIYRMDA